MNYDEFLEGLKLDLQKQYGLDEAEKQFVLFTQVLREIDPNGQLVSQFSLDNLGMKLKSAKLDLKWKRFVKILHKEKEIDIDSNYISRVVLKTKSNRLYEFLYFKKRDIGNKEIRSERVVLMKDEIYRYIQSGWDKQETLKEVEESFYQMERQKEIEEGCAEIINSDDEDSGLTICDTVGYDPYVDDEFAQREGKRQIRKLIREKYCYNLITKILNSL